MVSFPPCKINLGLSITGKRADGYHNLETCFYPIAWTDILEVIPSDTFSFTSSGIAIPGREDDNLCIKAYHLLQHAHKLPPVRIHLHKIIPMGAGLGGGSSDAAYTLRLLNSVFKLGHSATALAGFAAQLGSDCAFFTQNRSQFGEGRGEVLSDIDVSLKGNYIVMVKPNVHVSTADAYAGIHPHKKEHSLKELLLQHPLHEWRHWIKNDFEESVFKKHPSLQTIKTTLYEAGAVYACMSGSGSTVFGIFQKQIELSSAFPDALVWSGIISA
ncbi:4-(cytidine 5'-diphospho)-2-C-methyl-D-erythritol kinase [Chryseolinea lacunae]|uniref:4-diphosphocytidyl-2-C-methyl-D-erythritol kinase n=1 Tax=Chryseolinea lacunae TaxID=2801331 RepID=A0ABS1KW65_9BACT|nr:4-(cytidine 5'-diphospho)-2-C-methyl-D-erythritol kinase [Chryseolinea lacunae]MBL0742551.1 4-(cytidine 5'-diphospho)-2-C-methyl-D-erythritol kinase [Chryseolinea lacunae]